MHLEEPGAHHKLLSIGAPDVRDHVDTGPGARLKLQYLSLCYTDERVDMSVQLKSSMDAGKRYQSKCSAKYRASLSWY